VSKVKYKAGWRFYIEFVKLNIYLRIETNIIPDADRSDVFGPLRYDSDVTNIKTEKGLQNVIECVIKKIELHEVKEWLRFDGVRFYNPHPESRYEKVLFEGIN